MAQPTNPMAAMVGIGGDIYIQDTSTQASGTTFSHIFLVEDCVINDIKVDGASVKTARKYTGTIPAGYLICAGEGKEIDYFKLTSGSAEGIVFKT